VLVEWATTSYALKKFEKGQANKVGHNGFTIKEDQFLANSFKRISVLI
jgi:hypothetical protein